MDKMADMKAPGLMKKSLRGNKGQAFSEYVMVLALVAITCLAGVKLFSKAITKYYSNVTAVYTVPIP